MKSHKFELWEGEKMKCDVCGKMLEGDGTIIYMRYRIIDCYVDPIEWVCGDCMQNDVNAGWPPRRGFPPVVPK